MAQTAKQFADKLNQCLDENGMPSPIRDRAVALSKLINISKQQAWSLLEGQQMPDEQLIENLAKEFDVDIKWLQGH